MSKIVWYRLSYDLIGIDDYLFKKLERIKVVEGDILETFYSTFEAVAILFVIGVLGFSLISKKVLPLAVLSALSPLLLEVSLPALSFVKVVQNFNLDQVDKIVLYPVSWALFTFIAFLLSHLFKLIAKRQIRGEFAMSLFFQNAAFIPLILIDRLYGKDGSHLVNLFLFTVLYSPFFFNFYHIFFEEKGEGIRWKKVFHPVVVATLLAVLLVVTGLKSLTPSFVIGALAMVGGMAIPLLMIIVGGNIYVDFQNSKKFNYFEVAKFVLVKNFIFPLIAIGFLYLLKFDYELSLIIFLQAAVPPLMAIPIFAIRMKKNVAIVNQYILGSLAFSIISIPTMFGLFERLF